MIKTIIIEDEFPGQQFLKNKIEENFPEIEIVAIEGSVNDAIAVINKFNPHLVFLDIELINGTGFDVLEKIDNKDFEVIFTTAYSTFAIKAIKAQAFDYILKPINVDELIKSVQMAIRKIKSEPDSNKIQNKHDKILIQTERGGEYHSLNEILYFEAAGQNTIIVKKNLRVLSLQRIGEFEQVVNSQLFMRCHHSFIINLSKIEKYHKGRSLVLFTENGYSIPVSQRKRKVFLDYLTSTFSSNEE